MIVELALKSERKMARELIEASGLAFEDNVDVMYGMYENEQLVATGSRAGNILKMLALAPDHQGGSVLGELVTELVMSGQRAGHESLFVYTKPEFIFGHSCQAVTAVVSLGAGVFSTVSACGHTAAHRARQAVIAAVTMILFFILVPPLWM